MLLAQTPAATHEATATTTLVATATPTAVVMENAPTLDDLKAAQKEIGDLGVKRDETSIQYGVTLLKQLGDVTRELAKIAQRSGDQRQARELLKDISALEAVQKSELDQDLVLLEKKSHLKQLNMDRVLAYNRILADKFLEAGNSQRVQEINDGIEFLNQMKILMDQKLELDKELLRSQVACEFKTAVEIRQKQEDLRKQIEELDKQTRARLQILEDEGHSTPENRQSQENQENL
jgi:hypothetical protein